jgi:hypothetical protein
MVLLGSVRVRRWVIWMTAGIVALCGLLVAACDGESTQEGPGPVGPVGPVGAVGDEEEGIPGSGEIATEIREIADFDRLVFSSEGTVILTEVETVSLSIEADDNLQQYLTAGVSGGELVISTAENTDIAPSRPIVFRVGVVDLTGIELAGVGRVTAETLEGTVVAVVLSGTGDISINQLHANAVTVNHNGVGTIRLEGEVDEQQVVTSGVGDYDGGELASRKAIVEASESGKATVWVTDELELLVSDSGAVAFYGSPAVDQEVSGLGAVTPLGSK